MLQDLQQAMPDIARSMEQLLQYDGDVENTFGLSFEVEYDYFGQLKTHELKPNGSKVRTSVHASVAGGAESACACSPLAASLCLGDSAREIVADHQQPVRSASSLTSSKTPSSPAAPLLSCVLPYGMHADDSHTTS